MTVRREELGASDAAAAGALAPLAFAPSGRFFGRAAGSRSALAAPRSVLSAGFCFFLGRSGCMAAVE